MSETNNPLGLSLEALQALVIQAQKKADNPLEGRRFIRVLDKFFEHLNGNLDMYSKQTIIDDFGKDSVRRIPKYNGFRYEPSYFSYQRDITVGNGIYWNLHEPFAFEPEEGEWKTIDILLKHVFQEQYEMILDWIQILLTNPKQALPIPCLVSSDQDTGKTAFLKLIQSLIKGNTAAISIDDFAEPFNSHYVSKHVVLIDETETDGTNNSKSISSKLKRWVTQETVIRNEKNQPRSELPFYGKMIMASNHEDNFIRVEDEDTRYWIRKVPVIAPEKRDPNFEAKMKAECKHFAHFLQHRTLQTPTKQGRLWFSTDQIRTKAFSNAVESSRSNIYHDLKELLLEDLYRYDHEEWFYTAKELMDILGNPNKFGFNHLKKMIEKNFKKQQTSKRFGKEVKRGYNFTREELIDA
jgi:hypothetical protein